MERVTYSIKGTLALLGVTISLLLCLLSGAPQAAQATESPYCGTTLNGLETCYGAARTFNAVYGSGRDHAVCVGSSQGGNVTCSSNPNEGTYDALGGWVSADPWIKNQGFSSNRVGGIAFTP
jgi:hypothetical protein